MVNISISCVNSSRRICHLVSKFVTMFSFNAKCYIDDYLTKELAIEKTEYISLLTFKTL